MRLHGINADIEPTRCCPCTGRHRAAPYVHNLLGVEYVKTDRLDAAVSSFEQAVLWLLHDAMTHYNFGLALNHAGETECTLGAGS